MHPWNPVGLLKSPIFTPLHPLLHSLQTGIFPGLKDLNRLLLPPYPVISVQAGYPLQFVPQAQGRMGFEAQYEPRCYLSGEVQTRPENWHDLFNAMVWLTYPKSKAAINTRHYHALKNNLDTSNSQRGKVRDMATLLDESGVIIACSNPALIELLKTFQWKELFWHRRDQVRQEMGFYIFGHGLYEKALQPYVGMTGQGLILQVAADFFEHDLPRQLSELDQRLAEYLDHDGNCLTPRALHPVPILGVPGWVEGNEEATYYDDTTYFRAGRRELK